MKQTLFLIFSMAYLTYRARIEPFFAVLMYYGLAVLRPQAVWDWALPQGIRWSFFAGVVAITATIVRSGNLGKRLVQPRFIWMIVAFAVLILLSWAQAMDPGRAQDNAIRMMKILAMVIVGAYTLTNVRYMRYLAMMIFLCLMFIVYEINIQYLQDHYMRFLARPFNNLDNNNLALMLAAVVPFGYYFFMAERRLRRWIYLACTLPGIHAVMLSYSRGAMLSLAIVGVGIILDMARHNLRRGIVVGTITIVATLALAGQEVRDEFRSIYEDKNDESRQSRLDSWAIGWQIACDYFPLGVGPRNSNLLTYSYGADMEGRSIHNVYLQFAADVGIPAAALFTLLMLLSMWWLWRAAHMVRTFDDDDDDDNADAARWHQCVCLAAFWAQAISAIGCIFLSFETFELMYIFMLMGAVAPGLSEQLLTKPQDETEVLPSPAPMGMGLYPPARSARPLG